MPAGDKARKAVDQWALRHEMIPEQLDPLAEHVRDLYVKYRRSAFPYYNMNTTKYNIVFWRYVATKVNDCGADPVTYVSAAFKQGPMDKIYPEALLSVQVSNACVSANAEGHEDELIERSIVMYASKLQHRYDEGHKSLEELLTDVDVCGCPLFIWCTALKHKLYQVAERYKSSADRLLMNPAYRRVYTRVFKEVFDGGN